MSFGKIFHFIEDTNSKAEPSTSVQVLKHSDEMNTNDINSSSTNDIYNALYDFGNFQTLEYDNNVMTIIPSKVDQIKYMQSPNYSFTQMCTDPIEGATANNDANENINNFIQPMEILPADIENVIDEILNISNNNASGIDDQSVEHLNALDSMDLQNFMDGILSSDQNNMFDEICNAPMVEMLPSSSSGFGSGSGAAGVADDKNLNALNSIELPNFIGGILSTDQNNMFAEICNAPLHAPMVEMLPSSSYGFGSDSRAAGVAEDKQQNVNDEILNGVNILKELLNKPISIQSDPNQNQSALLPMVEILPPIVQFLPLLDKSQNINNKILNIVTTLPAPMNHLNALKSFLLPTTFQNDINYSVANVQRIIIVDTQNASNEVLHDTLESLTIPYELPNLLNLYKCDFCKSKLKDTNRFRQHMIKHGKVKRILCKICNTKFWVTKLSQHLIRDHFSKPIRGVKCQKYFITNILYIIHPAKLPQH